MEIEKESLRPRLSFADIDVDSLTPREALQQLYDAQRPYYNI